MGAMADKMFSITEMRRVASAGGAGAYVPTGARFEWSAQEHSVPRDAWRMPMKQRTVRVDLPGSEEPVEQVLGWNFEPFTLDGVWDDRYMGAGAAFDTFREFERLVQRGNLCKFEFELVTIHGIITDFAPTYKRKDQIRYQFTVSPHFRLLGDSVRAAPPAPPIDPRVAVETAIGHAQEMDASQKLVGVRSSPASKAQLKALVPALTENKVPLSPPFQPSGSLLGDIQGGLDSVFSVLGEAMSQVQGNILDPLISGSQALNRLSQRFMAMKSYSLNMMSELNVAGADTKLAYQTAVGVLEYETWRTEMAARARRLWLDSHETQRDLSRRSDPKAKALYRPVKGESLYSISSRFYGTPHEWRRIMERNSLTTLVLQGTEFLIIPELS